jgi:hypothetical protein
MASACSRESLASRLALHLRHKPPIIASLPELEDGRFGHTAVGLMSGSKLADHLRRFLASLGILLRLILLSAYTIS